MTIRRLTILVVLCLAVPFGSGIASAAASLTAEARLFVRAFNFSGTDDLKGTGVVPFETEFDDDLSATAPDEGNGSGAATSDQLTRIKRVGDKLKSISTRSAIDTTATGQGGASGESELLVGFRFDQDVDLALLGTLDTSTESSICDESPEVDLFISRVVGTTTREQVFAAKAGPAGCSDFEGEHLDLDSRIAFDAGQLYELRLFSAGRGSSTADWDLFLGPPEGDQPEPKFACGDKITESIVLDTDLDCTRDGLRVGAPDITIDLGGHTLTGDRDAGDSGIDNSAGHDGVKVRNGSILSFGTGVLLQSAERNTLSRLLIESNRLDGVALSNSSDNTLRNVTSRANNTGMNLVGSNDNDLLDNLLDKNTASGIKLGKPDGLLKRNFLSGNRSQDNGGFGIQLVRANSNILEDNNVDINDLSGISLKESADNQLTRNVLDTNVQNGILIDGGQIGAGKNILKKNRVASTQQKEGIVVLGSDENELIGNKIVAGLGTGVQLFFSNLNTIENNIIRGNAGDGLEIRNGTRTNFVKGNTFDQNGRIGLLLTSTKKNDVQINFAFKNEKGGFLVRSDSELNTFVGNTARENFGDGFEVSSEARLTDFDTNKSEDNTANGFLIFNATTTGRNNTASGNGSADCSSPGSTFCAGL